MQVRTRSRSPSDHPCSNGVKRLSRSRPRAIAVSARRAQSMRPLLCFVVALFLWAGLGSFAHAQPTRGRGEVSMGVFAVRFARVTQEVDDREAQAKQIGFGYPQLQFGGAY